MLGHVLQARLVKYHDQDSQLIDRSQNLESMSFVSDSMVFGDANNFDGSRFLNCF